MEAERFVGTAIVQLFPFIGIDVIHHPGYIFLCQVVKAGPFRQDPADQLVVDFDGALLVRTACVTIINACPSQTVPFNGITPVLDFLWIRELAAVVSYDHRKIKL